MDENMVISMPRGDIRPIRFTVRDENGIIDELELTEVYFTVKNKFKDETYLFQKRLSDGDIERLDHNDYQFQINPEDTDDLKFGNYVFDIELVGEGIKQTFIGTFTLTEEATYASNE